MARWHTLLTALAQIRIIALRNALTSTSAEDSPSLGPGPASAPDPGNNPFTRADLRIHPGAVVVPPGPGLPCPAGIPPVRLSDAETARLDHLTRQYAEGNLTRARLAFHYRWSDWRRRHQARARWHHYSTRLAVLAT